MNTAKFLIALEQNNLNEFASLFDKWFNDLSKGRGWPHDNTFIPLYSFIESSLKIDSFQSPGIYIFGANRDGKKIPRYIGMTEDSLLDRLLSRYFCNKNGPSQIHLTTKYIQDGTVDINKKDFYNFYYRAKCKVYKKSEEELRNFIEEYVNFLKDAVHPPPKNPSRCMGALDFALHETDMWFTLMAVDNKDRSEILNFEKHLIPLSNIINYEKQFIPLVNQKYDEKIFKEFCKIRGFS